MCDDHQDCVKIFDHVIILFSYINFNCFIFVHNF